MIVVTVLTFFFVDDLRQIILYFGHDEVLQPRPLGCIAQEVTVNSITKQSKGPLCSSSSSALRRLLSLLSSGAIRCSSQSVSRSW
jgi:hypothetical protein